MDGRTETEWRLREWSEYRPALLEGYTGVEMCGVSVMGRLIESGPAAASSTNRKTGGPVPTLVDKYGHDIAAMIRVDRVEREYRRLPEDYSDLIRLEFLEGVGRVKGCVMLGVTKDDWYRLRAEALGYIRGRLELRT